MKNFILRIFTFACALMAGDYLLDFFQIRDFKAALIAAVVFALLNTFIKPALTILSFPITLLTFGLFSFVINGLIFYMVSGLVSGFYISSFIGAIGGSIVVSIINVIISNVLELNKK